MIVVVVIVVDNNFVDRHLGASTFFLVGRTIASVTEGSTASRTREGPFSGVSSEVRVENVLVRKEAVAVGAGVDVLARVHVQVTPDVVAGGVSLAAHQTDVTRGRMLEGQRRRS